MAEATELTASYLTKTTPLIGLGSGVDGTIDANLELLASTAVTADGNTTAIDVEGGSWALWNIVISAQSGTSPTLKEVLQASIDGGSNYFSIAEMPLFNSSDAGLVIARPAWIPRPTPGSDDRTKVRINHDISGTSPSFTLRSWLSPMKRGGNLALEALT